MLEWLFYGDNGCQKPCTEEILFGRVWVYADTRFTGLASQFIGQFGMAKTVVGFLASSLSTRVDTDSATTRALLVFLFFLLQNLIYAGGQILLLNQETQLISWQIVKAALVNPIFGVLLFSQLDRFRKAS